ncbi:uncharacterized protein CEXT_516721 [Caerostris extrusa]|uniref:Uncharacterized protein n=1 Tax=Caerostris extrusa TaxID=172846 RepID=A0AAV4V0K1_CAEEX|nr:uncharacterized protein CEXT_516721 [Caerostris extrusa]
MYIQRKKFTNKLCKYKSKECEDGFSSMADDECSFNCSCYSCVAKFSRQYKRNMNRNSLGLLDNDKSFFTRDQEIKEVRSLPPVPEIVSAEDDPKSGTNDAENSTGQALSTTWYQCDDSLCKTPVKESLVATEKQQKRD